MTDEKFALEQLTVLTDLVQAGGLVIAQAAYTLTRDMMLERSVALDGHNDHGSGGIVSSGHYEDIIEVLVPPDTSSGIHTLSFQMRAPEDDSTARLERDFSVQAEPLPDPTITWNDIRISTPEIAAGERLRISVSIQSDQVARIVLEVQFPPIGVAPYGVVLLANTPETITAAVPIPITLSEGTYQVTLHAKSADNTKVFSERAVKFQVEQMSPDVLEELEESFQKFAQKVLELAKSRAQASGIPQASYQRVSLESVIPSTWDELRDDYKALFTQLDDPSLWQSEDVYRCVHAHWEHGVTVNPREPQIDVPEDDSIAFERVRSLVFQQLLNPLIEIATTTRSLTSAAEEVVEAYRRHRDTWIAVYLSYDLIVPLLNFSSDITDEVTIGPSLRLAMLTNDDKEQIWNLSAGLIDWQTLKQACCKLVCRHEEDQRTSIQPSDQVHQVIGDTITALRLHKPGDVTGPVMFDHISVPSVWHIDTQILIDPNLELRDPYIHANNSIYEFSHADVPSFLTLFENLRCLAHPKRQGLRIGLMRFNRSYSRADREDQIIDLTIALEGTLLAAIDSKQELKYRMGLRGAALLQTSTPGETKHLLDTLYDVRSSIVHGGKLISELRPKQMLEKSVEQFCHDCEDVARAVLKEYVTVLTAMPTKSKTSWSIETINTNLDERIISSLSGGNTDSSGNESV